MDTRNEEKEGVDWDHRVAGGGVGKRARSPELTYLEELKEASERREKEREQFLDYFSDFYGPYLDSPSGSSKLDAPFTPLSGAPEQSEAIMPEMLPNLTLQETRTALNVVEELWPKMTVGHQVGEIGYDSLTREVLRAKARSVAVARGRAERGWFFTRRKLRGYRRAGEVL